MLQIQNITSDPLQTQTVVLPNGNAFTIAMYYIPLQYGWFFTNITYQTFTITGLRISNNPNMLYQYQQAVPFGLACFSASGREPTQQLDFVSGASSLYILTQQEVAEYTAYIQGGPRPS